MVLDNSMSLIYDYLAPNVSALLSNSSVGNSHVLILSLPSLRNGEKYTDTLYFRFTDNTTTFMYLLYAFSFLIISLIHLIYDAHCTFIPLSSANGSIFQNFSYSLTYDVSIPTNEPEILLQVDPGINYGGILIITSFQKINF